MAENRVVIELVAKDEATAKFLGATRKIEASIKGLETTSKQSLGNVGSAFTSFKENWVKITAAIGTAYAAIRSMQWIWEGFKESAAAGEQIRVFSEKTGMAAEEVTGLQYAAEQVGVPLDSLNTALVRMVKNTGDAAQGTGKAKRALAELGVDAKKLATLDTSTQLSVLAQAFTTVSEEADRTRLAVALFGRGGADMIPLLAEGAAGIEDFKKKAQELGLTITDEMAIKLDEANDAIQAMERAFKGLKMEMAAAAGPGMADLIMGIVELIKWMREGTSEAGKLGEALAKGTEQKENPFRNHIGFLQEFIDGCKDGVTAWEKLQKSLSVATSLTLRSPIMPTAPFLWLKDWGEQSKIDKEKEKYGPAEAGIMGPGSETAGSGLPEGVFVPKKILPTGEGKGDLTAAADKAMAIYKELAASQTLTAAEMESLWEGYKKARLAQIDAEAAEMQKLVEKGLDPALIKKVTQERKDNLETEMIALRTEIARKTTDAETSVYKGLMESQNLVATDMEAVWEGYKEKRLEQINLEAESMKALKIDAEIIADFVSTQTKQMDKDIEAFRAKYKELRTPVQKAQFEAPTIEKTLASEETTDQEWQDAWSKYEEYRSAAIEKELADLAEAGHEEAVILMERKRKYRELYDYIQERSENRSEQELTILQDLAASENISAEDRKRVWAAYYDLMIEKIELAGQKMKDLGEDAALVDAWVKNATADVKKEMNKATDEWSKAFDGFTEVIDTSFKSGLSDMFKGGVNDMGNYWQEFLNTMVESWMRAVASMAVNKILWGSIGGKESGGTGGLFGILNKNKEKVEVPETLGKGKKGTAIPETGITGTEMANIKMASMGTVTIQNAQFAKGSMEGINGQTPVQEETPAGLPGGETPVEAGIIEKDFSALQKTSLRMEIDGGLLAYMPAKETSLQTGFFEIKAILQTLSAQVQGIAAKQTTSGMEGFDFGQATTSAGGAGLDYTPAEGGPGLDYTPIEGGAAASVNSGNMFQPNRNRLQAGGIAMTPANVLIGDTPEIVLPLNKFASFMDDYDQRRGTRGGGGGKNVVVNYHINAQDVKSFMASRAQIMAQTSQALIKGRRDM